MPSLTSRDRSVWQCALSIGLVVLAAAEAQAQAQHQPVSLAEIVPNVILNDITLPLPTTPDVSHVAHFSPVEANDLNNPAVSIVQSFNKLMMTHASTCPPGLSSGGFTY